MSTPHIEAKAGEIASIVLMPGDPLRAKYIADTYLKDVVCFNKVRNMFGYTGTYNGTKVSVMGSGMGMPSIGIYSYELYTQYDVEAIIRIGSAGAYSGDLDVYDIVLAKDAWSESSFRVAQSNNTSAIANPSMDVNEVIQEVAKELGKDLKVGRIHSSDVFYHEENVDGYKEFYGKYGCLAVEMESFALFHNAEILGKKAACILTISDSFITHEVTTAQERQTSFNSMMEVALESAVKLSK